MSWENEMEFRETGAAVNWGAVFWRVWSYTEKKPKNLYRSLSWGSGEHCHVHVKEKTLQGQRMNRNYERDYPQCIHRAGMHSSSNQKEQRALEVYPAYSVDSPQLSRQPQLSSKAKSTLEPAPKAKNKTRHQRIKLNSN